MTPREAFQKIVDMAIWDSLNRRKGKPGDLVVRQPEEVRGQLRKLTTEETLDVREEEMNLICETKKELK